MKIILELKSKGAGQSYSWCNCISTGFDTGMKDIFECFMMVFNYRLAVLKPRSPKG